MSHLPPRAADDPGAMDRAVAPGAAEDPTPPPGQAPVGPDGSPGRSAPRRRQDRRGGAVVAAVIGLVAMALIGGFLLAGRAAGPSPQHIPDGIEVGSDG